jgi:phage/plasmid-associated DNA primase
VNRAKEIQALHDRGFVILRATRTNNSPIGWKRKQGAKTKWGYVDEMNDPHLTTYRSTFSAEILARSHCGFYLGHGNLCCIDLDTKKVTLEQTTKLKNEIVKVLGERVVVVETTKSNGYHIYFLYAKREQNQPDWTGKKKENWIEVYYSKRFIACYLSNSKKYSLERGEFTNLKTLSTSQYSKLLNVLRPYEGKKQHVKKSARKEIPVDEHTWKQAEAYVKQLEEKGLDITGDNHTWFKIGKGFANAFGAKGYEMFNRLSQFGPTYNADTIEAAYENFVSGENRARDSKITIASFFKMCNDVGLLDLTTQQTLQLHPPAQDKEFELILAKKESMAEHVHTMVTAFLQHVEICCLDSSTFYIFEQTHWIKRNVKQVIDLINNFVDRSDVDARYRKKLRTVPYLKMAIEELKLITLRDALEPNTGNLHEGIFVNMENGILHVNLKTGKRKLLDHESSYNFTTILPFCYEPAASCAKFDAWLLKQIPDKELHTAYYAFVASCLTRHKADIIMLLAGETSTGKSSLIDVTRRLIGLENSVAISAGILFGGTSEAQTQAMQMENKLLAYDFDSQPFRHLEMLLKVAAQEPIPGWQMHVTRRAVVNYGRVLIAMNPYSYSVFNPAVARRLITVNMNVKVEKDNTVMPEIYEEVAGIFNHVLNIGVRHLIENVGQIKITGAMRDATVQFHTRGKDAVRWFESKYFKLKQSNDFGKQKSLKQKLYAINGGVEPQFMTVTSMYQEYRTWLEDEEGYAPSRLQLRKHFAEDLRNYGVEDGLIKENGEVSRGVYVGRKSVT